MGSIPVKGDDVALQLKMPASREFLGGDLLAQCLAALGVEVAYTVGILMPF